MTEAEKMAAGLWYQPYDTELNQQRMRAKTLCHQYNQLRPDAKKEQRALLKRLFGSFVSGLIEPTFYCDYGFNLHAGAQFYANHGVVILDAAPVIFGDKVLLGPGVLIATVNHPLDASERAQGLEQAKPIRIGDNVWIGMGAKILPGVAIGDNAVVAAGAVVSKDVAANTLVAGVPARAQKQIGV